ncbi:unnamed protein product [Rotaria sordida]|uniref:Uncharacterized protein n=1 Tax=Rotaria sordida TaxID=392033 RepID=A0A814LLE5_9BILA|nr:unnamed protein product [Rotaria sordida]CAF1066624.1 unnamed protein product [Rotaria sordida]
MNFIILIIIIYILTNFVESTHFYGGTITWKPTDNTTTGSTLPIIFTQSYQWRQSGPLTYCNQSYVLNHSPQIPTGISKLICVTSNSSCGGYNALNISGYCTDFSTILDLSSSQISTVQNITIGSKFCIAFQGATWIGLQTVNCVTSASTTSNTTTISTTTLSSCYNSAPRWSIGCCLDLSIRLDGLINTPPVTNIISPINLLVDTETNIKIPVIDANNDVIRCRWAQNTSLLDECGDVCGIAPASTLNSNDCILTFNSTGTIVGQYYPITLMIEDYYRESSYLPYSSIPLQFLIKIINKPSCFTKPMVSSNLSNCTPISVGVEFNFTLTIQQSCSNITIVDLFRTSPLNMYKNDLLQVGSTNIWIITETWIPTIDQIGSQVYCAIATDSNNIQSDQYCTTFTVLPVGQTLNCPTDFILNRTTTTTNTTTTSVTMLTFVTTIVASSTSMIGTVYVNDNSGLNSLNLGLILGFGLPLLLLLIALSLYCCCCQHCQFFRQIDFHYFLIYYNHLYSECVFFSGKSFRRYLKRDQNVDQQDNLPDYRHQYINDNNIVEKKYQLTYSNKIQSFTKENSHTSLSLSDVQTNYMNITKTSFLSPSSYSLPTIDVQYARYNSSATTKSMQNDSILMRDYSIQQKRHSLYTS